MLGPLEDALTNANGILTTKEQHMGTGLGLWISKEIAQKHGAEITVESSTDDISHGKLFAVRFSSRRPLDV
jgi:signal transduction histidine kinase